MQTTFSTAAPLRVFWAIGFFLFLAGCQKNSVNKETSLVSKVPDNKEENAQTPASPPFQLEAILRNNEKGFGHVTFRQDNDAAKIVTLAVWVRDLEPNHQYQLQRAVDTNLDGNCTSTSWLTLGNGLQPQSILTDEKGTGRAGLWRDVTTLATGATFDIHFQVIDAETHAVVLTSDCYEYTVR